MRLQRSAGPREWTGVTTIPLLSSPSPSIAIAPIQAVAVPIRIAGPVPTVEAAPPANVARSTILGCVADGANLLTLAGLACSGAAMLMAARSAFHAAGILMLGAYLADLFDGVVARRTKGRSPVLSKIGARLDSLADQVGGGVAPGVVLLAYSGWRPWFLVGALALLTAASMRLAYFDVHGLDEDGAYTGLPTDLVVLLFATLLLFEGLMGRAAFRAVLLVAAVGAAGLMVAPIRIPKAGGAWYFALPGFAAVVALIHGALLG